MLTLANQLYKQQLKLTVSHRSFFFIFLFSNKPEGWIASMSKRINLEISDAYFSLQFIERFSEKILKA